MTWLRDRVLQILGVLCLLGQGTLLFVGSAGKQVPNLALPGVFLVLTVILAVILALTIRRDSPPQTRLRERGRFLTSGLLVLAVGGMLAASLDILVDDHLTRDEQPGGSIPEASRLLDEVRASLATLPEVSNLLLSEMGDSSSLLDPPEKPGEYFRFLEPWPGRWAQLYPAAAALPVELIIWKAGLPLAWTSEALPLSNVSVPAPSDGPVRYFQLREDTWFIRTLAPFGEGRLIEIQIALDQERIAGTWPGIAFQVGRLDQAPVIIDEQGDAVAGIGLPDSQDRLALSLSLMSTDIPGLKDMTRARQMLVCGLAWFLALAGSGRLFLGWTGFFGAIWLGRALLAAVDYFRWTGPAFPGLEDPAAPDHLISLVGPAYFATPFAWGWFASTADALLTAIVLALTGWGMLRSMGLVVSPDRNPVASRSAWSLGQGPVSGLVFGLAAAALLLGLRFFAGLVAENANPRLIGQGVSLSFLSFWGLHVVLMLISFSLASLLAGWAGHRTWPERSRLGAWLAGALVVCLTVAIVFLAVGGQWGGLPFLAALVAVGFWLIAPAFRSRPQFLRRFAWPAVLLLAVVWNYAALREVYDLAERGWLERKGQLITGSGEDWTRYLLEDALQGMVETDAQLDNDQVPLVGIWQDKIAFRLWQDSALSDLGYSCTVEIIDAQGLEESYFAAGFMRDLQFEVVSRSQWTDRENIPAAYGWDMIFQTERRIYRGGEEEILAAEVERRDGRGWIRVELPTRSWRISTLLSDMTGGLAPSGGYRPRSEVDRPVMLLRGDDSGWLGVGDPGFQGPGNEIMVRELKDGTRQWALLDQGDERWLFRWNELPPEASRTPGEGFLLGLRQSGLVENSLDLSRIMLLNLALLFLFFLLVQSWYRLVDFTAGQGGRLGWLPGFQEKFLAGYLLLGFLLLLVVGMSVDKVGYDRVRAEARSQTREGLSLAVAQLRGLMVEQARSLASSDYIADLLVGQLAGQRPAGPLDLQQGMVFGEGGQLLLDETLSNLSTTESDQLLRAGRNNPLLVMHDDGEFFVATVITIDLSDAYAAVADTAAEDPGHGQAGKGGFFLYRQRFDQGLLIGLADLARGQATLSLDGQPILASHPGPIFTGQAALLASPSMMASLLDHPGGPGVFAQSGRPFAFTGSQPMPAFGRDAAGLLVKRSNPAVLALAFPDREREYASQRRETVLFLAGLANLILLTALLLALLMSWNLFRPLRVLLTATRRLARGDFDAPLPDIGSDEVGRLTDAFGRMRSELHTARDRLAAREQFLTTVLDQVTVGVVVVDSEGNVVALNPAGRHILTDFLPHQSEEEAAISLLEDFRATGLNQSRMGGELRSADGRHTLRGAMAPLELPSGRVDTMLVFEDITEFLQTKKMAINAELARQVAHEIKNPLTPIQLSVQLLDQAWQDKHPQLDRIVTETVARVLGQVELLRTIASEFSLLGRPGELELVALDLAQMTSQVVDAYGGVSGGLQNGVQVEVAPGDLPEVMGDPDSLQKILGNLMQNSLDAARPEETLAVKIDWEVSPRSLTMVWVDNGQGLPPEVADRLFDPYFSTKSKGTGLGLAICRNLADRMGGNMTLANRSDAAGARATLTLPRVPTP